MFYLNHNNFDFGIFLSEFIMSKRSFFFFYRKIDLLKDPQRTDNESFAIYQIKKKSSKNGPQILS